MARSNDLDYNTASRKVLEAENKELVERRASDYKAFRFNCFILRKRFNLSYPQIAAISGRYEASHIRKLVRPFFKGGEKS